MADIRIFLSCVQAAVEKAVIPRVLATTDSKARPVKPLEQEKKLRSARIKGLKKWNKN